ncbi:MAG: hypothetical protein H6728_00065 [Myxococcales bacterium]|nr:hypothetical protein [Myxococcales bacterium]MCB9641456.1 hypothetical protein [Myxococcales bacterium]
MAQTYFATTLPDLEEPLQAELRAMRCKRTRILPGGVEFEATRRGLYQALYTCRFAHRILLRLDDFRAGDLFTLHRKTERIEWSRYIPPDASIRLHIASHRSRVHSRDAIEKTVVAAIQDALHPHPPKHLYTESEDPSTEEQPFGLWVRLEEDRCTLSLDATGPLLYQRGWRQETGEAPIRESIACSLLWLLGWSPSQPLVDPVCGSGTFLIEAARIQKAQPPRFSREYLAQRWADFDETLWKDVTQQPISLPSLWSPQTPEEPAALWGFDHNAEVLSCAQRNAHIAETTEPIQWKEQAVEQLLPPTQTPGFVIANPPYGKRISRKQRSAQGVEQQLLSRFAQHFSGWQMGLLLPRSILPQHKDLQITEIARFRNGGFPVTFWKIQHNA